MTTGRINQIRPDVRVRISEETLAQVDRWEPRRVWERRHYVPCSKQEIDRSQPGLNQCVTCRSATLRERPRGGESDMFSVRAAALRRCVRRCDAI